MAYQVDYKISPHLIDPIIANVIRSDPEPYVSENISWTTVVFRGVESVYISFGNNKSLWNGADAEIGVTGLGIYGEILFYGRDAVAFLRDGVDNPYSVSLTNQSDVIDGANYLEESGGRFDRYVTFIDAELGFDVFRLPDTAQPRNYRATRPSDTVVILEQIASKSKIDLRGFEKISFGAFELDFVTFTSEAIALDFDGVAGQAYRIYRAAFDRAPEPSGLGYWIAQMDKGMDVVEVAARFIDSSEFRTFYGRNPTNAEFVTKVYSNVLDRTPDVAGLDWWVNEMKINPSKTWQKVLADFAESTENQAAVASLIANGIAYEPWDG